MVLSEQDIEQIRKTASVLKGRLAYDERFGPPTVPSESLLLLQKAASAEDPQLLALASQVAPEGQLLETYEQLGGTYRIGDKT